MDGHKPMIPPGLALPEEEAMELWLRVMAQLVRIFVLESWSGKSRSDGRFQWSGMETEHSEMALGNVTLRHMS